MSDAPRCVKCNQPLRPDQAVLITADGDVHEFCPPALFADPWWKEGAAPREPDPFHLGRPDIE